MGDAVLLEIFVECNEIQTQLLRNDIYRGAAGQCGIHIHHVGIETIAGIGCYTTVGSQFVITLIPMTEAYEIAVLQLTTLWHSSRTRGVEEDKKPVGL